MAPPGRGALVDFMKFSQKNRPAPEGVERQRSEI